MSSVHICIFTYAHILTHTGTLTKCTNEIKILIIIITILIFKITKTSGKWAKYYNFFLLELNEGKSLSMTCHLSQIFIFELRAQWCFHLVFLTGMPHTLCPELCYCSCHVWEDVYLLSITQRPRILQRDCHVFWHNTANRPLSLSTTYFCSP